MGWQYAAPDQRRGGQTVDHRVDQYALGLIIGEAFTGEVIQGAGYRKISGGSPNFGFLDPIVDGLVQQDPDRRFDEIGSVRLQIAF